MHIAALNIHPVKSTAIRPVARAAMEWAGLRGDRRWMITDPEGELVSARERLELFTIVADTPDTDAQLRVPLRLSAPGVPTLDLTDPSGVRIGVQVHDKALEGIAVGAEADAWLRQVTGADLRLIWCDDPSRRVLNPDWSRPGEHTAFADSAPITLVSRASLTQLNAWIADEAAARGEPTPEPLPIERFRPNIVIDDVAEAFAEDGWPRVQIGDCVLRRAKPTSRCVMTTIDLDSLTKGKEPIRTLARHRRWDGKTWFAVRMVPETLGTIGVGDTAIILD
ncbi:MOSC domain-containing protein [Propionibacteriaceae bacterium Y1700]|uniref:MOSC domain-containing protein n=1 Tax=Microlunatus sp. Y1700 TaxID=3418487 RepID=UPI003DA74BFC